MYVGVFPTVHFTVGEKKITSQFRCLLSGDKLCAARSSYTSQFLMTGCHAFLTMRLLFICACLTAAAQLVF